MKRAVMLLGVNFLLVISFAGLARATEEPLGCCRSDMEGNQRCCKAVQCTCVPSETSCTNSQNCELEPE